MSEASVMWWAGEVAEGEVLQQGSPLAELLDRPAWHARAACRGRTDLSWFPEDGENEALGRAKAVCASCPVAGPCAEAALAYGWRTVGVWGGMAAAGRRRLRVARNAAGETPSPPAMTGPGPDIDRPLPRKGRPGRQTSASRS